MARSTRKKSPKSQVHHQKKTRKHSNKSSWTLFGYRVEPWIARGSAVSAASKKTKTAEARALLAGRVFVLGRGVSFDDALARCLTADETAMWQRQSIVGNKKMRDVVQVASSKGPAWFVRTMMSPADADVALRPVSHEGLLQVSSYARARDLCGTLLVSDDFRNCSELKINFIDCTDDEKLGALVGFELASYTFKNPNAVQLPYVKIEAEHHGVVERAAVIGVSVNIARHLTNLSPNILDTQAYAHAIQELLNLGMRRRKAAKTSTTVDVWESERVRREGLNLLDAVGGAADQGARLVHIRHRSRAKSKDAPVALIGKGIVFDSGGLDLKPAAGMRWMKKDMAGSASLVGFAYWLTQSDCEEAIDIYLALAENAVSHRAFHPGDVIKARSGISVEIHNTDAEGRLVMADAMAVALEQEKPRLMMNFSTLTGAMRVALGTELFGVFANHDSVLNQFLRTAQSRGERGWRMPLFKEYEVDLKSTSADIANASSSGFAGAITAALFLEKFNGSIPWLHVDMYGWQDRPQGAYVEMGANGQCTSTLIAFAENSFGMG